MSGNIGPDPQDPSSPLYDFIDEQPESPYPNNPDSSLSHITVRQFTPENITAALPIVVTKTAHGLQNGQAIRCTMFIVIPYANATGMAQLNNKQFYAQQCTANTFILCDNAGVPIDGRGFTPYIAGGQMTVVGNTTLTVNPSHFPPPGVPVFPPV